MSEKITQINENYWEKRKKKKKKEKKKRKENMAHFMDPTQYQTRQTGKEAARRIRQGLRGAALLQRLPASHFQPLARQAQPGNTNRARAYAQHRMHTPLPPRPLSIFSLAHIT